MPSCVGLEGKEGLPGKHAPPKGGGGDWEVASRQRLQPREQGRAPQMPPPSWSPQLRSLLKGFISRCAHPFHNPTSWSPAP